MRFAAVVLPAILFTGLLSGCLGGDEPQGASVGATGDGGDGGSGAAGGGGGASGGQNKPESPEQQGGTNYVPPPAEGCDFNPQNITESRITINQNANTTGGAHQHDWWGCDTEVVIMDRNIQLPAGDVCVGSNTFACQGSLDAQFVRFMSDPDEKVRPNIVFPGAGKMVIKIDVKQIINPFYVQVQSPGYPDGYSWGKGDFLITQASTTITLDKLRENHTDAPHTRSSAWVFRLWTGPNGPSVFLGPMHWKVTVFRDTTRTVPLDPPHPDFWADRTSLILYQGQTTIDCKRSGVGVYVSSGACGTVPSWPKNHTVMVLSKKLVFELTYENTLPVPTKLGLEFCAPGGIPCGNTGAVYTPARMTEENGATRRFEIEVRPDQWDSPYRPTSGWTFHWYFENPDGSDTGAIQGKLTWKVELFKL